MTAVDEAIAAAFDRHHLSGRIAIALSGGLDSMVLLEAAWIATRRRTDLQLEALHVHHGLSRHADEWVAFCEGKCEARGIPLSVARVQVDRADTGGVGLEAAARAARYDAFIRHGAPVVLAAQHADDQAETVLHQLLRGTGWAGLAAMGECRPLAPGIRLIRPLLALKRKDLESYARARSLLWIEDDSNQDTTLTRNFLRHEVLPRIAFRFPHYADSLGRAARHAAEADTMLEVLARIDLAWNEPSREARADALDALPLERQVNALYHWLRWQGAAAPSREQLEEWARQLFRAPPAGKPHRAGGHGLAILRRKGVLTLSRDDS